MYIIFDTVYYSQWKTFAFLQIALQQQKLFGEFLHLNTIKAGNHEHFSWNEGKDVRQRKFFTANDKQ